MGRDEEAVVPLRRLVELVPEDSSTSLLLGSSLQRLGRMQEALEVYGGITEEFPEEAEGFAERGMVLEGLGRYREADRSFRKAKAIDPGYFDSAPEEKEAWDRARRRVKKRR